MSNVNGNEDGDISDAGKLYLLGRKDVKKKSKALSVSKQDKNFCNNYDNDRQKYSAIASNDEQKNDKIETTSSLIPNIKLKKDSRNLYMSRIVIDNYEFGVVGLSQSEPVVVNKGTILKFQIDINDNIEYCILIKYNNKSKYIKNKLIYESDSLCKGNICEYCFDQDIDNNEKGEIIALKNIAYFFLFFAY